MKNLKKVLALVVVFSMMLSTVAFAAFPDVAEDADYANAVNTIAALGIVGGDDQGNFNPDNTITRAEFTKMICEAQAIKGDAAKGATIFTDVAADHWASGYINMAVGQNIINGMGDGTFAPESPVTYEQAIKMIVVALGYEPMAADRGGYPTGYMVVAQSIGVTKGVKAPAQTDAAKRSLIAELIYNALDVPMMEQTGFGSDKTFEIMDGTNDKARVTLLTSKFDVVKLGGVVTANDKVDIIGSNKAPEGEIKFRIYNNYKTTNDDFTFSNTDKTNGYKQFASSIAVGDTEVADLLGQKAIIFVQEDNNDYVVIAAVADEAKATSVEFALTDIDTGARTDIKTTGTANSTLAYFADDNAKNSTKLDVLNDTLINVIWNNAKNTSFDTLDEIVLGATGIAGKVTLTDWNNDNVYDVVAVEVYEHFVVTAVEADSYTIEGENSHDSYTFSVDAEEEDYAVTIKDVDGNDVAIEDIKEGDVIAVLTDDITGPDVYLDIVVLGANVVEGTVVAWDPTNASGAKATIGDAVYTVSTDYTDGKIDISSEGAYYLDINGNIFDFDGTKAASGNFGIILKAAVTSSGVDADVCQIKLLNKDGQIVVYNVAETVKVRKDNDSLVSYKRGTDYNIKTDLTGTAFGDDAAASNGLTIGEFLEDIYATDLSIAANYNDVAKSVVQYKANANGEITELTPNGISARFDVEAATTAEYSANSMRFAGAGKLEAGAILFSLSKSDISKSKVIAADALVDEADYDVALIDVDGDYTAAVILSGGNALGGAVKGWAVVTGKATTNDAEGNTAYNLTVVENNKNDAKSILVTEDTLIADDYAAAYSSTAVTLAGGMGVGSILLYTADEAGNALVIAPIANVSGNGYVAVEGIDLSGNTAYGDDSYVLGITNDKFDGTDIPTNVGLIEVESGTNKYRFNNANPRNLRVEVGSYKGGNVINATATMGNVVLARYVENEVADVITVDTRVANDLADVASVDFTLANPWEGAVSTLAVDAIETAYNKMTVEFSGAINKHQGGAPSEAYWVGVKVTDLTGTADKIKYAFGSNTPVTETLEGADWNTFYIKAENGNKTVTFTFMDGTTAVSEEITLTIDVDGVTLTPAA